MLLPGVLVEADDYCFSSMMFTSVVGVVTVVLLMSGTQQIHTMVLMIVISTTLTSASAGLSITLLCARLNRRNQESKESAADVVHNTLRCENIIFREIAEFPEYRYYIFPIVDVKVYVLRMTIFAGRATGRSTSTLHRRGFLDTGRDVMEEGVAVLQVT